MRYVLIPDDIGPFTYQLIQPVLVAGKQLVVWRPSLLEIDRQFRAGLVAYNADNFVELVNRGHVVVCGRAKWFAGQRARDQNPDWAVDCPWEGDRDAELARMAREDLSLPLSMRRVIVADEPTGYAWADRMVQENSAILEEARSVYLRGHLPNGFMRKASHFEDVSLASKRVLTIARNVAVATEEVLADVPIQPSPFAANVALLGHRRPTRRQSVEAPSVEQLMEVILVLGDYDRRGRTSAAS